MVDASIGNDLPRVDGLDKLSGATRYVDDLRIPGVLHGGTIRSPAARGRITGIHFDPAVNWSEFVIVDHRDIPGPNVVALIEPDQPALVAHEFRHKHEPIVLIAHRSNRKLRQALRAVRIEFDPLPTILDPRQPVDPALIQFGTDNVFKRIDIRKGDPEPAFVGAAHVIEGEYATGSQEHVYIEAQGMLAYREDGRLVLKGSMQCPYYVHKALMPLFGLPENKVRVIQMETGGGFGGKEEYPSMIAGHAALLAWKTGQPVKLIYDRAEDMAATTKRHPSRTRHRTAVSKDGKLLGMEIDFVLDGGAYATLSAVVLSRGTIHAAGPYHCPHVRIRSRAVATNTPPYGAFRGFGAPQSTFALERHLNKVARAVGLTPEELRRRNFLKTGETTATGQVIRDRMDMGRLLERAFELTGYSEKVKRFTEKNKTSRTWKGIGFASFMHGAGFTGSGEEHLASVVGIEATEEGRVRVLAASTEIGQGTNTILSQIAADTLRLDYDKIEIAQPDTAAVPDSGPTVASRTCMIVGKLVESAALGLQQTLLGSGLLREGYSQKEFSEACCAYIHKHGPLKSVSQYQPPPNIHWDEENYRGDAYAAYAWAVYVAEVTVDTLTCEVRVDNFLALQDAGKIIHPVLAAGQIEGGVAQGIGHALYEQVVLENGRMVNNQFTNYIIPTAMDTPPIRVVFEESPSDAGPKGIGELPLDGTAVAIVNAIEHATGCAIGHIPVLPESLMEILWEKLEAARA